MATSNDMEAPVLAVDLDGTLIRSDSFVESVLALLRSNPLAIFQLLVWLFAGRAAAKQHVAAAVSLDPAELPYDPEVLAYVRSEHAQGRYTVLATGSDQGIAQPVADYLGCFDEVLASDGSSNRTGASKQTLLLERHGQRGYDYIGNSRVDLPVWESAQRVLIASGSKAFVRRVERVLPVDRVFAQPSAGLMVWVRQIRVYQWLKNLLIFVPLLVGHSYDRSGSVTAAVVAFFSFSLCSSSVYLLNDLLDLPFDRHHPRKSRRPLASGQVSIITSLLLVPVLLLGSLLLALQLPGDFLLTLVFYFLVTVAYSTVLKRVAVVDVMVLAGLYTLRVIAGGMAVGIMLSFWLLAFSLFIFLSLALMKRYTEVRDLERGLADGAGRGYSAGDSATLAVLGGAAGYSAVLVLALYINSDVVQGFYTTLYALWMICPVILYWISHMWFAAHRAQMDDDPIVFAIRDPVSLLCAVALAVLFVLAL